MINLDVAHEWLNLFDKNKPKICFPLAELIAQINAAVDGGDQTEALGIKERAVSISDQLGNEIQAAMVRVECARAIYYLGCLEDSLKLLDEALEKFGAHKHNKAAIQWMRGYLLWQMPDRQPDAIYAWQRCCDLFSELVKRRYTYGEGEEWYKDKMQMANYYLDIAIANNELPASIRDSYPVIGEIPFGGIDFSRMDENKIGVMNIRKFRFAKPYKRLVKGAEPFVLLVKGDSMNLAGIEAGDFVLIDGKSTVDHAQIVAAEINETGQSAELWRFLQNGDKVTLMPESKNPSYNQREFSQLNDGFTIRGVVVAIAKP